MASFDGEYQGQSVTRGLARHRLKHPESGQEKPMEESGEAMTVEKHPAGGYKTKTKAGEMHHPTINHAVDHMKQHFGETNVQKEKEPGQEGMESPESGPMPNEGGLGAMGIEE